MSAALLAAAGVEEFNAHGQMSHDYDQLLASIRQNVWP